jgi:uncharacterized protein (DUF1697 family)
VTSGPEGGRATVAVGADSSIVTKQVAFLRAVNVGKRTVAMSRLGEIMSGLGFENVSTYINSGNVIFDGSGGRATLEATIGEALEAEFGFEATTFVRTVAELRKVLAAEPFDVAGDDTYFITFLQDGPDAATAAALEALSNDFDTLVVIGRDVHWRMHGKSTDTLLKKKDWRIVGDTGSTSRNVTMLRKLVAKADARN